MAIITSWAVGVDNSTNRPAAATAGRLYFETDTTFPYYDSGSAWVPWRDSAAIILWAGAANTLSPAATPNYTAMGNPTQASFTPFRQARLHVTGLVGGQPVTVKAVDTDHSVDITGTVSVSSTTATHVATAWTNVLSTTYAGDAIFDLYALESTTGATAAVTHVYLELR